MRNIILSIMTVFALVSGPAFADNITVVMTGHITELNSSGNTTLIQDYFSTKDQLVIVFEYDPSVPGVKISDKQVKYDQFYRKYHIVVTTGKSAGKVFRSSQAKRNDIVIDYDPTLPGLPTGMVSSNADLDPQASLNKLLERDALWWFDCKGASSGYQLSTLDLDACGKKSGLNHFGTIEFNVPSDGGMNQNIMFNIDSLNVLK